MRRAVLACAFLVLLAVVAFRLRPSQPLPASAPARQFSAHRAFGVLSGLLREQVPHPVASPANAIVRDRIVGRFRELGYDTAIQQAYSCSRRHRCATVENILVTAGDQPPAVLGVAHYDSVPRGPGASDDGVGVASMLEIARAIRGERFRNTVGFLITDGEELGMLGAEAFVRDPKLAGSVHAVVNVENRGTSGPSFLFETSRNNYALVGAAAQSIRRPFASSLFYTVYTLLPNDTDVSVFKRAGKQAVNFAAIGDVRYYHTPQDDLAHVDLGTLQHAGENALAMLRALGKSDLQHRPGDAVFFDVLGLTIVYWPAGWTIWIVVISAIALIAGMRRWSARAVAIGIAAFVVSIFVAAVIGFIAVKLMPHRMLHPFAAIAAMWLAGITSTLTATHLGARASRPQSSGVAPDDSRTARGLYAGFAIVWLTAGGTLALTLPGVSFLFVAPAAIASVAMHWRGDILLPSALWLLAAGLVFFPLALMVYTALGTLGLLADAVLLAIVTTTFAPAIAPT